MYKLTKLGEIFARIGYNEGQIDILISNPTIPPFVGDKIKDAFEHYRKAVDDLIDVIGEAPGQEETHG